MTTIIKRQGCEDLRQKLLQEGLPPAAARVLSARQIASRKDIMPSIDSLPKPHNLPDIDKFCQVMGDAIKRGDKICVVGDYDADGMCATALAVQCLRKMDVDVSWRIPQRHRHGYGLHPEIVEAAADDGVKVLLTVDNGASATDAIIRAKELNLQVCVTDHHLPAKELPPADCTVNPQCVSDSPMQNLAGVGVIFYAMAALRTALNMGAELNMSRYLDLVAVGSIADCVSLDKINRALVGKGLDLLRSGKSCVGLRTLSQRIFSKPQILSCGDIAFRLAPHLNAAGRFSRPELSVELLMTDNEATAHRYSQQLESFNKQRAKLVNDILQQTPIVKGKRSVVLYDEAWPPEALGVLGILAGRLVDTYQVPAVALARHQGHWRGSGRVPAIEDWDLHQLLHQTAITLGDGVIKFGGHRRAAGMEVRVPDEFATVFDSQCVVQEVGKQEAKEWQVDELPPPDEITSEGIGCLQGMVWGEGFPRPIFAGRFSVSQVRQTRDGKHSYFNLHAAPWEFPAIAFNCQKVSEQIDALFTLSLDRMSGDTIAIVEEMA